MGRNLLLGTFFLFFLFFSQIMAYPCNVIQLTKGSRNIYLVSDIHLPENCGSREERVVCFRKWAGQCLDAFEHAENSLVLVELIGKKSEYSLHNKTLDEFYTYGSGNDKSLEKFLYSLRVFYREKTSSLSSGLLGTFWNFFSYFGSEGLQIPQGMTMDSIEPKMRWVICDVEQSLRNSDISCEWNFNDFFKFAHDIIQLEVRLDKKIKLEKRTARFKDDLCRRGIVEELWNKPIKDIFLSGDQGLQTFLLHEFAFQSMDPDSLWQYATAGVDALALDKILSENSPSNVFVFAGQFHTLTMKDFLVKDHGYTATSLFAERGYKVYHPYEPCDLAPLVKSVAASRLVAAAAA